MKSVVRSALLLVLALGLAVPASAQRLDGIAAVVNDEVVLQSDVEEQLYLFLMRAQARPDSTMADTLRRQILDQLIDEKLIVSEAKRQGLTAPDAEVNKQVEEAIREAKERMGSAAAFDEQLRRENLTEEKLREKYRTEVRRQLLAQRVVQKAIVRKPVTATEAETYFKEHPDKFPKAPPQVRVSVIQIPAQPDSNVSKAARQKALAARKRLVGGERFAKVAAEVSEDPPTARSGGDLGFVTLGQTDPEFDATLASLKIGEISQPVKSGAGWHIIEVLERDTVTTRAGRDSVDRQGRPVLEAHARHVLIRVELSEADIERSRVRAEAARAEARKGADFSALVKKYSRYEGPQNPDGDLGFLSLGSLQPNIAAGLDSLAIGEVSEVLLNRSGFNVFKVTDRKPERPYTLEEIRADLPEAVGQIQFREKYEAWIKTLRSKAVIKINKT